MKALVLLFAVVVASAPAFAEVRPMGSGFDSRIQRVAYNEGQVVVVYAAQGVATQIVFAPGEEVLSAASGFTEGWQFAARGNTLNLKPRTLEQAAGMIAPKSGGPWDTNLNVTTNRRNYSFVLRLVGGGSGSLSSDPRVAYRVEFTYPLDAMLMQARVAAEQRIEATSQPVPRNTAYTMSAPRKSRGIAPAVAFDDGRFTYFKFPNNREIPSFFIVSDDGQESLVNYHVQGDFVVIQRVARRFALRLGSQVIGVVNEKYDPDGIAPDRKSVV